MTVRRLLAIAPILLCPLAAQAQTKVLIVNSSFVDNQSTFGAGSTANAQQIVIPRTAGGAGRSKPLRGLGASETKRTANPAATAPLVITEGYGVTPSAGVTIQNLWLDGGQKLGPFPWFIPPQGSLGVPSVADGMHIDCAGESEIGPLKLMNWKGTALHLIRSNTFPLVTSIRVIKDVNIRYCYSGIVTDQAPDVRILNTDIANIRDYGIWARGGNTTIEGGHLWGGEVMIRTGGHVQSGPCQVNDIEVADAHWGWVNDVPGSTSFGLRSNGVPNCWGASVLANARTHIWNATIRARPLDATWQEVSGVDFAAGAKWSSLSDSMIMVGGGSTGVLVTAPAGVSIQDVHFQPGSASAVSGYVDTIGIKIVRHPGEPTTQRLSITGCKFNGFKGAAGMWDIYADDDTVLQGLHIDITTSTFNRVHLPAGWTGRVIINGVPQLPEGVALPVVP